MKITAVLIALVLFGLLATRIMRSMDPVTGRAAIAQVREARPPAAFTERSPNAKPVDVVVGARSAQRVIPPTFKPSDARELQAVRDLYEALSSADTARREHAFAVFLPALIALDPDAAGYLAETWERGPVRTEFLHRTALEWAKLDWMSAVLWAANLKDAGEQMNTLSDESILVSRDDPVAAIAIEDYFKIGSSNTSTLDSTVRLWAGRDLLAASDWVRRHPPGKERDRLMTQITLVKTQTSAMGTIHSLN